MKRSITLIAFAASCTLAQAAGDTYWKFEHLYSFNPARDGSTPLAGLVEQSGVFWGTTSAGGPGRGARGNIFKFVPGSPPVVMHTFRGGDGATPMGELLVVGAPSMAPPRAACSTTTAASTACPPWAPSR